MLTNFLHFLSQIESTQPTPAARVYGMGQEKMTETTGPSPRWSDPRLAPFQRADLPSFLIRWSSEQAMVEMATQASARLGLPAGTPAPRQAADIARGLVSNRARPFALARLRLPMALAPHMFYCSVLDLDEGPAVLFADPATYVQPARETDAEPAVEPAAEPPAPQDRDDPRADTEVTAEEPLPPADTPPLRFTYETDAAHRLRGLSATLLRALGDGAAHWHGATFQELEDGGWIISAADISDALNQGASFAGVRVTTPGPIVLDLELGGIPLFDGTRRRIATRGFGVLRTWPNTRTSSWISSLEPDDEGHAPHESPSLVPLSGSLSPRDSETFRDIGRTLHAVMSQDSETEDALPAGMADESPALPAPDAGHGTPVETAPQEPAFPGPRTTQLLDALPFATLLEQDGQALHLNTTFLEWTGWPDLAAFHAAGDIEQLVSVGEDDLAQVKTAQGEALDLSLRPVETPFLAPYARLLLLRQVERQAEKAAEAEPADARADTTREQALDLVPWPVLLLDRGCEIRFANTATETLLGFTIAELIGQPLTIGLPPETRGAAIGWFDQVAGSAEPGRVHTSPLTLRTRTDERISMLAGLARMDGASNQLCLVLGPQGSATTQEQAVADMLPQAPQPAPEPLAPGNDAETAETRASTALHVAARRLTNSLSPALTTLLDDTADDAQGASLPQPVADALRAVRQCLSDLAALAQTGADTPAESAGTTCAPAPIVQEALAHVGPSARRRRITIRTDIAEVPPVTTQPPRLARLVRLMLEEALDATPAQEAVIVSLTCDEESESAPVLLEIADGGAAIDEVALAAARAPLQTNDESDRFSQAGRPLRYVRLNAEAEAIGARFSIRRGQAHGMHALLELPR